MKIIALILLFNLFACTSQPTKPSAKTEVEVPKKEVIAQPETFDSLKTETYALFLNKLDLAKLQSNLQAMNEFKKLTTQATTLTSDTLYRNFRVFYQKFQEKQQSLIESDTLDYCAIIYKYEESVNQNDLLKMKLFLKNLQSNGISMECSEGTFFITHYNPFIKQHFLPKLSPIMQTYLAQEFIENENWLYEDAGIAIPLNAIIDRIVWHENFEKENPDFSLTSVSVEQRMWHQNAILNGSDNTPLMEYQGEEVVKPKLILSQNFSKAFNYATKTYPNATITKAIIELMQVFSQNSEKKLAVLRAKWKKEKMIPNYDEQ